MPGALAVATPAAQVNAVNSSTILTNAVALEAGSHTALLQMLEREVGGKWFAVEQFEQSVGAWDGTPVIFASEHPNLDAYDTDPDAELARIGGRIVGEVTNARIETTGHPRLMGELSLGGDTEAEHLCATGALSLSTAFRAMVNGDETAITSPPRPHHVLVFEERPGKTMPRDPGSAILNGPPMDITNAGREFSAKNAGKLRTLLDAMNGAGEALKELLGGAEPKGDAVANAETPGVTAITTTGSLEDRTRKIAEALKRLTNPRFSDGSEGWISVLATFEESVIYSPFPGGGDRPLTYRIPYTLDGDTLTFGEPTEVETAFVETAQTKDTDMNETEVQTAIANAVAEKDTAIANANAEIASLREELAKRDQAAKDAEWTAFKNAEIPAGKVATPEQEAELRQMAETQPLAFARLLNSWKRPEARGVEGQEFTNATAADDPLAVVNDLRKATGTLR